MSRSQLTHRQRVQLALDHKETDRVPIAMVCSGINRPAREELERYLQQTKGIGVDEYLKPLLDISPCIGPKYIGPLLDETEDFWGVRRRPVSYGSDVYDEIEYHPLAKMETIDELIDYRWPSTDWFDYCVIPDGIKKVNRQQPYAIMIAGGNVFETTWYMRGFEQALLDLAMGAELIDFILEKVTEFYVEHTRKKLQAAEGQVDLVFTADDIGGQEGLLMSLDLWRKHIKPHHRKLNELIHSFGAKVIYHSDGAVMAAVDDLIEMGIDVLQALQFDAKGMDPVALKRDYGDRLCFQGGISVQRTLPFGTPEKVRDEVLDRIAVLGANGGYILGPSHAIQAGTPPENIVAMFDTAGRNESLRSGAFS